MSRVITRLNLFEPRNYSEYCWAMSSKERDAHRMDKLEILGNMKRVYAECKSFREVGRVPSSRTTHTNGRFDSDLEYKIWFQRPSHYRVECRFVCSESAEDESPGDESPDESPGGESPRGESAGGEPAGGESPGDGKNVSARNFIKNQIEYQRSVLVINKTGGVLLSHTGQFGNSPQTKRKIFDSVSAAFAEASPLVRTLRPFEQHSYLDEIKGVAGFPMEMVNHHMCHHLVIYSFASYVETHLWIDEKTFLVQKIHRPVNPMYRPFVNLLLKGPGKILNVLGSNVQIEDDTMHTAYIVTESELNPDIDPFIFEFPENADVV